MRRFIYLFFVVALLGRLATKSTNYIRKKKQQQQTKAKKKTGNFNRGENLGLPHTGYGPGKEKIKIKITAKFRASRRLGFEDTKRIMSPEMARIVSGLSRKGRTLDTSSVSSRWKFYPYQIV